MADYKAAAHYDGMIRTSDNKVILRDDADPEWQAFTQWLAAGGIPDPALPPQPPSPDDLMLLNHENRLRGQEGKPPLNVADFREMKRKLKPQ